MPKQERGAILPTQDYLLCLACVASIPVKLELMHCGHVQTEERAKTIREERGGGEPCL